MPNKSILNRSVRCLEFKIISIRREIRNQHVEMHQIPSMEKKSTTSSAKPVSLLTWAPLQGGTGGTRPTQYFYFLTLHLWALHGKNGLQKVKSKNIGWDTSHPIFLLFNTTPMGVAWKEWTSEGLRPPQYLFGGWRSSWWLWLSLGPLVVRGALAVTEAVFLVGPRPRWPEVPRMRWHA